MDTYLLMLYVTFEQEKAVQQLFKKEGWEFSKLDLKKTTSELGPLVSKNTGDDGSTETYKTSPTSPNRDKSMDSAVRKRLKTGAHQINSERVTRRSSKNTDLLAESMMSADLNVNSASVAFNADDSDYGDDDDDFEDNMTVGKHESDDQERSHTLNGDDVDNDKNDDESVIQETSKSSPVKGQKSKSVIDLRRKRKRQVRSKAGQPVPDCHGEKVDGTSAEDEQADTVTLVEPEEDPVSMTNRRSGRVRKLTEKLLGSPYGKLKTQTSLSSTNFSSSVIPSAIIKSEPNVATELECTGKENEEENSEVATCTIETMTENENMDFDDLSFHDLKTEPMSENDDVDTNVDRVDIRNDDDDEDYKALDSDTDDDYADEVLGDIAAVAAAAKSKKQHKKHEKKSIKNLAYKCEVCEKAFTSLAYLKIHEANVHDIKMPEVKSFSCKVCGHKYFFKRHMLMHMLDKHGVSDPENVEPTYHCEICGKWFFLHRCYMHHMGTHKGKEKTANAYICDICGKHFNRSDTLSWHVKTIHFGMKRPRKPASQLPKKFLCDKCDRGFKRQQHLDDHIAVWHDPSGRKYKCNECTEMFIRPHQVQYHMNKVHLRQKPYKCSNCQIGFYSAVALRKHYLVCSKSHLNLHQCKECGKNFGNDRNLEMHMEAIHSTDLLTCECGVVVKWRSSMAKHRRKCRLNTENCEQPVSVKDKQPSQLCDLDVKAVARLEGPFKLVDSQMDTGTPTSVENLNEATVSVSESLNQNAGDGSNIDTSTELAEDKWNLTETADIPPEAVEILKQSHIEVDGTIQYDVSSIIEQQDETQNSIYYVILKE